MGETARRGPKEFVTREALDRLKAAINRITRSRHPAREPLVCSLCHNLISLETMGMVCADEKGQTVHADCYVRRTIGSKKHPTSARNQA
jgi:hypothetical protein